jgi:hypothetical protein
MIASIFFNGVEIIDYTAGIQNMVNLVKHRRKTRTGNK